MVPNNDNFISWTNFSLVDIFYVYETDRQVGVDLAL